MDALPDPAAALLVFAALVLLAAVSLWPERGIVARVRRLLKLSERVRLEDGVKHLFACEPLPAGRPPSRVSPGPSACRGAGPSRSSVR